MLIIVATALCESARQWVACLLLFLMAITTIIIILGISHEEKEREGRVDEDKVRIPLLSLSHWWAIHPPPLRLNIVFVFLSLSLLLLHWNRLQSFFFFFFGQRKEGKRRRSPFGRKRILWVKKKMRRGVKKAPSASGFGLSSDEGRLDIERESQSKGQCRQITSTHTWLRSLSLVGLGD